MNHLEMKKIIILTYLFFSFTLYGQTDCYHIDCGYFPPDPLIAGKVYFDTSIFFSLNSNVHEKLSEFNKDTMWSWQENFKVNIYNVEDTVYIKDTLLISEGFIYRNKKNDQWTFYLHPFVPKSRTVFYAIYVSKYFYMNDMKTVSLCGGSLISRSDIAFDFDKTKIEIKYPWATRSDKGKGKIEITPLFITCSLDTSGFFKCQAMTNDSTKIFEVESKYLQDELYQLSHYEYLLK
jgi:hypothetical protein